MQPIQADQSSERALDSDSPRSVTSLAAATGRPTVTGERSGDQELPLTSASLAPVRQSSLDKTGAVVPDSVITRAVQIQKDQFVEIPAENLKGLRAATSPDLSIQEFVSLNEIDPLYFETSYYVVPEEVGEKAYGLLFVSLLKNKVVALAELAMHGRDHLVVVRPGQTGLVAHTMFYASEVHLDEQFRADRSAVNPKEQELASTLIASLTTTFEPEKYKNGYQSRLQALISEVVGKAPAVLAAERTRPGGEVIDIADALRRSLAQLKKPAQKSPAVQTLAGPNQRAKKTARANA